MKKYVALALVLLTVATLFAGCGKGEGIKTPTVKMEDTLENRQNAIVELAKAYYYKNPYNQYDNRQLCYASLAGGRRGVVDDRNTPEYASEDMTMYNVCTSYAYHVLYGAVGYKLLDNARTCLTDRLSTGKSVPGEILLYQYECTDDTAKNHAAAEEMMAMLQPGDFISYARETGFGHTMIYVGDINADSKGDILHVDGGKYNMETGVDTVETKGSVWLNKKNHEETSAEEFLMDPDFSGYLGSKTRFSLIRPALLSAEEYPLTESVKTRMLFPGLEIYYSNGHGHYGAAVKGSELTYTLSVENHSAQNHEGIEVRIPVPAGTSLVSIDGEAAKGSTVQWTLSVAAGETVEHTYTVTPTAEVGTRIVAEGGYVHAIPLPTITTAVTSAEFTAEALQQAAAAAAAEGKTGIEFAEATYAQLGLEVDLPELSQMIKSLFKASNIGDSKVYRPIAEEDLDETGKQHRQLMIPEYFGGQSVYTNCDADQPRLNETRYYDLQVGDVVLFVDDVQFGTPLCCIYNGSHLLYSENGRAMGMLENYYTKVLSYEFVIGLRPTQLV